MPTMKRIIFLGLFFISLGEVFALQPQLSTKQKAKNISKLSQDLNVHVVKLALDAFYNSKKLGVNIKKPIITIIDYSLPSTKKRLWVLNIAKEQILYNSMVAHGINSGNKYATSFSNTIGSLQTSLGIFITGKTYMGRDGYSLRMKGLEKGVNDRAEERYIVLHGAPYVSKEFVASVGRAGRSWGCPAVEKYLAKPIINTIKDGTLIFSYYPDKIWLSKSKFFW